MKLTKEEFKVLWSIEEGMSSLEAAHVETGFSIEKLKDVYNKLEDMGLIETYRKEDFWDAHATGKAKRFYKKYKDLMPK